MRAKQARVIEEAKQDQKRLEDSISKSSAEIDTLKANQNQMQGEVDRLTKLEADFKAQIA